MSWGPRARVNYQFRKMLMREARRQARQAQHARSHPPAPRAVSTSTASHQPTNWTPTSLDGLTTLTSAEKRQAKTEVWTRGSGGLLLATAFAFFLALPFLQIKTLLIDLTVEALILAVEFLTWCICLYCRNLADDALTIALRRQQLEQAAAAEAAQITFPPLSTAKAKPATKGDSAAKAASRAKTATSSNAPPTPTPSTTSERSWQSLEISDGERMDQEMRWRRDMKHGQPTAEDRDRADLKASKERETDAERTQRLEQKIQHLEDMIHQENIIHQSEP